MTSSHYNYFARSKQGVCLLLMLVVFIGSYGQHPGADLAYEAKLDRMNVIRIDSFWRYQSKDDIAFASPAYDDSQWWEVNPQKLIDAAGRVISWQGIGWFRQRIMMPDSLRGEQIALMIGHRYGASEIYLDGKLVGRFGKVSIEEVSEVPVVPRKPVLISVDSLATHLIAIRFSSHFPKRFAAYALLFTGFRLSIAPPAVAVQNLENDFPYRLVSLSFMIGFFAFFFCVFLFYPRQLGHLMVALMLAAFSLVFVGFLIMYNTTDAKILLRALVLSGLGANSIWCIGLLFLYAVYYGRLTQKAWLVLLLLTLRSLDILYPSFLSRFPGLPFAQLSDYLILFEYARILFLGLKHKKSGYLILAIGFLATQTMFYLVITNSFQLFPYHATTLRSVLTVLTDLSVPLTYALYLAWEFGATNRDLRLQLAQVKALSQKTLEQQQEKQQILSAQKETLERQVAERTEQIVDQNKKITTQRDDLKKALSELKATQAQLIQQEKMASLGELTAGIAHEIQNPLNFVNNFSDVNKELIAEMKEEIDQGNVEEVKAIANDIEENEQKISHHGKRADAIVKGMLQHSRASTGRKEPIDINALADEYLRLAYHGLRAKDRDFNVSIETSFDESIGKIEVVPQDIGRVLLNLYNNAFYAVSERRTVEGVGYEPKVWATTKRGGNKVIVSVKDNGTGIPAKAVDKIFQPFFTTKPTGEGTGLGLSLSYDIIKAHGGEIKVESKEGQGAEFIIRLLAGVI